MSSAVAISPRVDLRRVAWWTYEIGMAALAFAVLWMFTLPERGWVVPANWTIWGIFTADYVIRLVRAEDRRSFVKGHIPELVASLPLDMLRIFRIARLARLARAGAILWRVSRDLRRVLGTNGLGYVLMFTACVVVAGGGLVWLVEPEMQTFGDALWWSIVTATTVGYGDISPASPLGRLVAVSLMIVGIGTIGMITASIATYFLGKAEEPVGDPDIAHIKSRLDQWDDLDDTERIQVAALLRAVAGSSRESADSAG